MMYDMLKENLAEAKDAKNRPAAADIIGVIASVDKEVFADKKKEGEDFITPDTTVIAVLKNQIKNTNIACAKAEEFSGTEAAISTMKSTLEILRSFMPPATEGDELRLIIQGLGATNMGTAMRELKTQAGILGFDYDGREASLIAKEIFV